MGLGKDSAHTFKSAVRAVRILSTVEQSTDGVRLAELSAALGLSKATALRTLETLLAERVLQKDKQTGRYSADQSAWAYFALYQSPARRLISSVQQVLDALTESTRLTTSVVLHVPGRRDASTAMHSAPHVAAYYDPTRAPDPAPIHATAGGKCYLAALPKDELAWYLQGTLARCTDRTITSAAKLRGELARVRKRGYALNSGEVCIGASAVAVPLSRADGTVVGGLALTIPRDVVPEEEAAGLVAPLKSAAARITALMSHESWLHLADEAPSGPAQMPSPWGGEDSAAPAGSIPRVRTVVRAVRLLAHLLAHPGGASLAELTEARGLRKSTTWRLLNSLLAGECICQDPPSRRYRIDPVFWLRRARLLRSAGSLADAAKAALQELAEDTGATAAMGMPDRDGRHSVTYQFALPDSPLCWRVQHSPSAPLHATAAGKVCLSGQPRVAVNDYMRSGLTAVTERTITSPEDLLRELESVRRNGYAVSQGEWSAGASAISVPIRDSAGNLVAAVTIICLTDALTDDEVRRHLPRLRQTADRISGLLAAGWPDEAELLDSGEVESPPSPWPERIT